MPRIPEQKRPSIDWASLSEKIGDFIVDKFSMPDKYFVDKYGEEWESKRDKQRKIDRSFHGLLPAKNASQTRLALEALSHLPAAAPIFGALIPLFRGQPAVKGNLAKLFRSGTKEWSGGDFPTEKSLTPSYWSMLKREASIYPLPPFRGKRDLWQIAMDEEDIRKYAQSMESFRKGGAIIHTKRKRIDMEGGFKKGRLNFMLFLRENFPLKK